jgi:hypothetical protein
MDPMPRVEPFGRPATYENGRWTILATHAGNEVVRVEPFADIDIELASLWADADG